MNSRRVTIHDPPELPAGRVREIGPYSRAIDQDDIGAVHPDSRAGRFLIKYEEHLIEHVGGDPSFVQKCLTQRCARLALHLALMEERALLDGQVFGLCAHNYYLAWNNTLTRTLLKLGIDKAAKPQPTLADLLKGDRAA
jgi:hypothetical protein